MRVRLFAASMTFLAATGAAFAAPDQVYVCADVRTDVEKNGKLKALAERAYGPLRYRAWSESEPCAVPTAVLTYKSRTVLISTAEPPYQAHACQATLTAHVFGADGQLTKTEKGFAQTGENCIAGSFKPITLAGQDGFAVEGSGGGQGIRAGWVEFYRFEPEAIRQFRLPGLTCTWIDYTNAGSLALDSPNIKSAWRIGGRNADRLFLTFKVSEPKSKAKTLKTEWTFAEDGLKLVRGRAPEAFADGGCL